MTKETSKNSDLKPQTHIKYNRKMIGKMGELIAKKFLLKKGYEIVATNWGNKWGEIDIVSKNNNVYTFVEVKTKVGDAFGIPEDMISNLKLNKIKKMAYLFLSGQDIINTSLKIDVISIVLSKEYKILKLRHHTSLTS